MSPLSPSKALHWVLRAIAGIVAFLSVFLIITCVFSLAYIVGGFKGNAEFPADCALVFGAAVSGYNRPGPAIIRRVSTAARLYKEGKVHRLIVSGGEGQGRGQSVSEASVMRAQAMALGVDPDDIVMEGESHSTFQNLQLSQPLAKSCSSTVGISDAYHLARIRFLASKLDWSDFMVQPSDLSPPPMSELKSIGREVLGILFYLFHIDAVIREAPDGSIAANLLQRPLGPAKLLT